MHDAFKLYSKQDQNEIISRNMNKMSEKLATLCSTLGECPNIRYRSDEFNRNKEFAKMLQEKLDAYKNDMESDPEKSKSTVLILDRGFDTVTPLLHGLTYQVANACASTISAKAETKAMAQKNPKRFSHGIQTESGTGL